MRCSAARFQVSYHCRAPYHGCITLVSAFFRATSLSTLSTQCTWLDVHLLDSLSAQFTRSCNCDTLLRRAHPSFRSYFKLADDSKTFRISSRLHQGHNFRPLMKQNRVISRFQLQSIMMAHKSRNKGTAIVCNHNKAPERPLYQHFRAIHHRVGQALLISRSKCT